MLTGRPSNPVMTSCNLSTVPAWKGMRWSPQQPHINRTRAFLAQGLLHQSQPSRILYELNPNVNTGMQREQDHA